MSIYYAGLDLGQAADYTALVIASQTWHVGVAHYGVVYLERFPLRTSYPDIVAAVTKRMTAPDLVNAPLVVDGTGCGRPVVDQFKHLGRRLVPVSIHGGDHATESEGYWRVPKRELCGTVQVLLQTERLKFAAELSGVKTLTDELLNFKVKIDPATAHDSYSSWRESDHDDCVLALALTCWYAELRPTNPLEGMMVHVGVKSRWGNPGEDSGGGLFGGNEGSQRITQVGQSMLDIARHIKGG